MVITSSSPICLVTLKNGSPPPPLPLAPYHCSLLQSNKGESPVEESEDSDFGEDFSTEESTAAAAAAADADEPTSSSRSDLTHSRLMTLLLQEEEDAEADEQEADEDGQDGGDGSLNAEDSKQPETTIDSTADNAEPAIPPRKWNLHHNAYSKNTYHIAHIHSLIITFNLTPLSVEH